MECRQETKVVLGEIEESGKLARVGAGWGWKKCSGSVVRQSKRLGNRFWVSFCAKIGFGLQNISAVADRVQNFYQCDIFYRELSSINPTLFPQIKHSVLPHRIGHQ
jgi:hypothetical protein